MTQSYFRWLDLAVEDADIIAELNEIRNEPDQIQDRFYRGLTFGTGGMRGKLGAGSNRMNIYTVRQATCGLAEYLLSNSAAPRVAISYDSRHKSHLFAQEAAKVLSLYGIGVSMFDKLMPTPALSFAVRQLRCDAGIMITASHNPAVYNGYKVYNCDGCQITEKAAEAITQLILNLDPFNCLPMERSTDPVDTIPESLHEQYYQAVLEQRIVQHPQPSRLSVVYTPLNGSGLAPVTGVLKKAGYADVNVVPSQSMPDGDFPTCPYPNPELPETLQEGIKLCREIGADIVLATDPDCDRVGVAVPDGQGVRILTGNEVGVLLLDYICKMHQETATMPPNPIAVKTIVTTKMAEKVASQYGVALVNVLTGFKYIGDFIGKLEQAGEPERFIFGFEESCGYLSGIYARDKDAVNACLLICDMAAFYAAKGLTLTQQMDVLYKTYGYYACALDSFSFDGEHGLYAMREIMRMLRNSSKQNLCGIPVSSRIDYLDGDGKGGALPRSDVLQYILQDETLLTVRPPGTEPNLKVYYQVTRDSMEKAEEALVALRERIKNCLQEIDQFHA